MAGRGAAMVVLNTSGGGDGITSGDVGDEDGDASTEATPKKQRRQPRNPTVSAAGVMAEAAGGGAARVVVGSGGGGDGVTRLPPEAESIDEIFELRLAVDDVKHAIRRDEPHDHDPFAPSRPLRTVTADAPLAVHAPSSSVQV